MLVKPYGDRLLLVCLTGVGGQGDRWNLPILLWRERSDLT